MIFSKYKKRIGFVLFISLVLYALWNGRNLILGPRIEIASPRDGATISENPVTVVGKAKNISFLLFNGRQIFVDENGNFTEDIALHPGYTVLELRGMDRFGEEKIERLHLYFITTTQ